MPPPSDPTLQIWYDGADATQFQPTNPSSGDAITQWNDKSAAAHNANPIGGPTTRPAFTASIQNGKSAVWFDGTSDALEANMATALQSLTGSSLIWVGKTVDSTLNQQALQSTIKSGGAHVSTGGRQIFMSGSSTYVVGTASGSAISDTIVDNEWHIHTLIFDGTQTGNSNRLKYRIDGYQRNLTFTSNVSSSTSPVGNGILFGTNANSTNYFKGYMGEVLLYTKALSPTEITNTENYLFTKWGTSAIPPSPTPSLTPSVTPSISITPSTSPTIAPPATGSQVTYTPATFFNAFESQSGVTTTNGISTNNGAWQLFYANQPLTILPMVNNIGLNSYAVGSNTWTWYAAVASTNNSTGSWGSVQTISAGTTYNYTAGGFNSATTNMTSSINIPANRYFLLANSGGPFYRTVRNSSSRTAMVSGSAMVTAINNVALGNWPSGGTTTIPTAFGGAGTGYTFYTGSVHVMSAKFVRTSDFATLTGSLAFNGTSQFLSYSPGFTFGSGAFTLEGWFYNTSNFTNRGIVGAPVTSPVGALNLFFASGTVITSDKNGGGGQFNYTMPSAITTNVWHHFIYNRNADGTTAVYIDGIRSNTNTDSLNYDTATDVVGRYYGGYWPGNWTNMRITIGTAVYDSTQTTQPYSTAPLTALANTRYLMLAENITTDSAGIQTVTNNNGVTRSSILKPF